tara:strand:+ start:219 stop:860 length:642 start_codon:yes stop_codon:yes gene_type:complete
MKKILAIIILNLSFILPSKADDIRNLQIEGMSIGDSALDFFSETLIKNGTKNNPINSPNQKYEVSSIYTKETGNYINVANFNFAVFEAVEITYKKNDRNYVIEAVAGAITNEKRKNIKNIEDCKKQKNEIFNDIKAVFNNPLTRSDEGVPPQDKDGKSRYFRSAIQLTPKSKYLEVEAICLFYKGKAKKDYVTNVGVTIKTDGVNDWLHAMYK